jgi:hypothetical protein
MGEHCRKSGSMGVALALVLAPALALGLSGCQKLFTTSLAKGLARSGSSLPANLTTEEAASLVDQVRESGDVDLAGELVSTLVDEIAGTSDPAKKQELEAAAAAAAVVACDATASLSSLVDSYSSGTAPSAQALVDLAQSIKDKATEDIVTACTYLDPTTGVSDPSAVGVSLSSTDYAIAAVVIMASVTPAGADPATFDYESLTGADAAKVAAAQNIITEACKIAEPGSPGYELLQSISEKFQLTTP